MGTLVTVASIAIHHLLESVHGWNSSGGISKAMRMHHWIDFHMPHGLQEQPEQFEIFELQ